MPSASAVAGLDELTDRENEAAGREGLPGASQGMMKAVSDAPETVTEALRLLAVDGYVVDFNLVGTTMTCPQCRSVHDLDHAAIERQFRFEGASDPGDEAIVLGLRCADCGALGVFVSAFGPDADPELLSHLTGPPEVV